MDKHYESLYKIDKKVQDFNIEHAAEFSTIPEYGVEENKLNNNVTKTEEGMQQQTIDIKSITFEKNIVRDFAIKNVLKYALRASVKADQIGEEELSNALDIPLYKVEKLSDEALSLKLEEMKERMKNNLGILTNLTQDDIDEMEDEIGNYNDIKLEPQEAIDKRKTKGTGKMKHFLDLTEKQRKNMGKLIKSYFPNLVGDWEGIIAPDDSTGIRHESIEITYKDLATDVVLRNVKSTISNGMTTVIKYSSPLGYVRASSLPNGNYTITTEYPTYITDIRENIGISDGNIVRLEIKLTKL